MFLKARMPRLDIFQKSRSENLITAWLKKTKLQLVEEETNRVEKNLETNNNRIIMILVFISSNYTIQNQIYHKLARSTESF